MYSNINRSSTIVHRCNIIVLFHQIYYIATQAITAESTVL